MKNKIDIIKQIRELKARLVSQRYMAETMGVSEVTVSLWMKGKTVPTRGLYQKSLKLARIAKKLDAMDGVDKS